MSTEQTADVEKSAGADIAKQGGVVASMTMLSRISGLVRDVVFSYVFGASQLADMFFVAFRIPNFFRRLFAEGAFNQAFVPVLVRFKQYGRADLLAFIAPLSGLFSLAVVLFVMLGVLFAPAVTFVFAPGFHDDPERFSQTAELVRITFPYLGFVSLVAYAGSLLNAHNRFAVPAFTPVLLNISLIGAATIALLGWVNEPAVVILAWGVLAAGAAQLVFQIPPLVRLGLAPRPTLNRRHPGVKQVGRLLIPAVLAASVGQINALVNTMLASTLITGSISWLYYADRLLELPVGLVAVALGTVMLPHLSRMASQGDKAQFSATLDWGIGLGLMLGLPSAVALYLLAEPLVATLFMSFGGGAMTPYDVRMAGYALEMFAIALPGFVLVRVLSPAFFANEDTKAPLRYASVAVAVNLIGSLLTFSWFGHVGLAWATAMSAWTHVVLLYVGLQRHDLYRPSSMAIGVAKSLVASSVLACGIVVLVPQADAWLAEESIVRWGWMTVVVVMGIIGYSLALFALGVRPRDFVYGSRASKSKPTGR
jgi:putative peptidoglycan lipid II flippase